MYLHFIEFESLLIFYLYFEYDYFFMINQIDLFEVFYLISMALIKVYLIKELILMGFD
jgi:hypothetical protein